MINNSDSIIDYLRLIRSENVGTRTFFTLLKVFGSANNALLNINDFAKRGGRKNAIKVCPKDAAEKELSATTKIGAEIISFNDTSYPTMLKEIPDAPPVLTVMGNQDLLNKEAIGVVGMRDASLNGRNMAKKLGEELAGNDYVVVSGMALGIDAAAHQGALSATNSSGTIAVLGTGIDVIYPPENKNLYEKIKESGLLISELPLSSKANPSNFPRRNRIVSGLGKGIVVVEARIKSGSLITAKLALEQGREVMAIPGSPLDPRSAGTNYLIKQGATLIEFPSDVIATIKELPFTRKDLFCEKITKEEFSPKAISENNLDKERKNILMLMGNGAVSIDDLIRQSGLSASIVSVILVELELAGRLERLAGNQVNLLQNW